MRKRSGWSPSRTQYAHLDRAMGTRCFSPVEGFGHVGAHELT